MLGREVFEEKIRKIVDLLPRGWCGNPFDVIEENQNNLFYFKLPVGVNDVFEESMIFLNDC